MLISDAIRNVAWDNCKKQHLRFAVSNQRTNGRDCFSIHCVSMDEGMEIIAAAIVYFFETEGDKTDDFSFVKDILVNKKVDWISTNTFVIYWPMVPWDGAILGE